MVRRAAMVVSGAMALALAAACGDDASNVPSSTAGAQSVGAEAGTPGDAQAAGAGGVSAGNAGSGGTTDTGTAGEQPGVGGEGGAPVAASGTVVGDISISSAALARAIVVINGVAAITDSDGHFQIRNAPAKYDLMVRLPDDDKFVAVYQGLTSRAVHANIGPYYTGANRMATVRGKLLGGFADPEPDDARKAVSYASKKYGYSNSDEYLPHDGFEVQPQWPSADDAEVEEGTIWALQYLYDFDVGAYEYTGFGRRDVSVKDGQMLGAADGSPDTDITLTDPAEHVLPTQSTLPDGFTQNSGVLYLGPLSLLLVLPPDEGTVTVPKLDVPMTISASASGAEGSSSVVQPVPAQGPLKLVYPLPPSLQSPDQDATGVHFGSEFFWDGAPEDSVVTVSFKVGDWTVQVHSAAPSVKLPDLAPLKVRLNGPVSGTWNVTAVGPASTVEEGMAADDAYARGLAQPYFAATSVTRDFVTGN